MTNNTKFPLGKHQDFIKNSDSKGFQDILNDINGGESFAKENGENMFFYLNPNVDKSKPHLYVENHTESQATYLTYLKYGVPDCLDAAILATYNVLAECESLILDVTKLKAVQNHIKNQTFIVDDASDLGTVSLSACENDFHQEHGANVHFDFNFFFVCGALGGVLLLAGALILNPVVAIVGSCVLAVGAVGMGYHRFFGDDSLESDGLLHNLTHTQNL